MREAVKNIQLAFLTEERARQGKTFIERGNEVRKVQGHVNNSAVKCRLKRMASDKNSPNEPFSGHFQAEKLEKDSQ